MVFLELLRVWRLIIEVFLEFFRFWRLVIEVFLEFFDCWGLIIKVFLECLRFWGLIVEVFLECLGRWRLIIPSTTKESARFSNAAQKTDANLMQYRAQKVSETMKKASNQTYESIVDLGSQKGGAQGAG